MNDIFSTVHQSYEHNTIAVSVLSHCCGSRTAEYWGFGAFFPAISDVRNKLQDCLEKFAALPHMATQGLTGHEQGKSCLL